MTAGTVVPGRSALHPDWCDMSRCTVEGADGWHASVPVAVVEPAAGEFEDARAVVALVRYDWREPELNGGPGRWRQGTVLVRVGFEAAVGREVLAVGEAAYAPATARRLADVVIEAQRQADALNLGTPRG